MGSLTKPQVSTYNGTPANVAAFQDNASMPLLQSVFANPTGWANFFQQQTASPLQGAANNAIIGALGSPGANAGQTAYNQAQPALAALMGGGAASGLNFGNQFSELQNPYGVLGGMNPALASIAASAPLYDEQRQRALADLGAAAPNRFSGGFVQEGTDLSRKSLQDYNAFAAQALQQGISQQQASQQMGLNFLLGARQLQQGAAQDTAGNLLQKAGLQTQAQTGGLGALANLSQGAMSGQNALLNFLLGAGNLGLNQQQATINPILQLLGQGLGYTQPQSNQPIVGNSLLQDLLGAGTTIATLGMLRGNNKKGS